MEVNLTDLARLRWIDGWSVGQLAQHFERKPITMGQYLKELRRGGIKRLRLEKDVLSKVVLEATKEEAQIQAMLAKYGR